MTTQSPGFILIPPTHGTTISNGESLFTIGTSCRPDRAPADSAQIDVTAIRSYSLTRIGEAFVRFSFSTYEHLTNHPAIAGLCVCISPQTSTISPSLPLFSLTCVPSPYFSVFVLCFQKTTHDPPFSPLDVSVMVFRALKFFGNLISNLIKSTSSRLFIPVAITLFSLKLSSSSSV